MSYADTRIRLHELQNEYIRRRDRCLLRFETSPATLALVGRIQDLRSTLGRERLDLIKRR